MPETPEPALSADVKSSLTDRFDDALCTEAALSKYRELLRPIAKMTSSWVGIIPPRETDQPNEFAYPDAVDGFVPLARVDSWEPHVSNSKLGKLHNLLFLQHSKTLYRAAHTSENAGNGDDPILALVTPRALPVEGCPIRTDAGPACNTCDLWAHCATGRLAFADIRDIHINGFHCMKVCKVDGVWMNVGHHAQRMSFRYRDYTLDESVPLIGDELRAVPQFESYYL